MTHLDLFSGIGGFALAVDRVWPGSTHIFCDNDKFCQAVLKKHWPNSKIYGDINDFIRICENLAPTVKTKNGQPIQTGERNVLRKHRETGYIEAKKYTKNISKESGKPPENLGLWSTRLMEENATVAVNQNQPFSPLTTLTEEGQKKEKESWDSSSTDISKTTISQKNTNFSAITAITENIDLGGVHTKYDLLTAGVPCQPASQAGRRRGKEDDRWLWPQTFTAIKLTQPTWVILENVRGLITLERGVVFKELLVTLEGIGYEAFPVIIPAISVNAPHRRDRVWIVANRRHERQEKPKEQTMGSEQLRQSDVTNPKSKGLEGYPSSDKGQEGWQGETGSDATPGWESNWVEVATGYGRVDDGISSWLDRCFHQIVYPKDYAKTSNQDQAENLYILWGIIQSPEVWGKLGGFDSLEKAEVLFSLLRCISEISKGQNNLSHKSKEVQENGLRGLWDKSEARCSPQRRQYQEQLAREFNNLMPQLPHEVSLEIASCWDYLWVAYSSMNDKKYRTPRLKALGNAIVPQVATQIMLAIKQTQ